MSKVRLSEVRTLFVPIQAATDAILELDRCHGGHLARGKVMEARVETGDRPGIVLVVRHATADVPRIEEHRFGLPAVAAAVIRYCSRLEVPLPRKAIKSIEIVRGGFEIKLSSATDVHLVHGEIPCAPVEPATSVLNDADRRKASPDASLTIVAESALSEATSAVA